MNFSACQNDIEDFSLSLDPEEPGIPDAHWEPINRAKYLPWPKIRQSSRFPSTEKEEIPSLSTW